MLLLVLAFLGGTLTILSPCVLPVIPFVFAQANRPFRTSGLPTLVGMAVTFAVVASAAAIGGGWVVRHHDDGPPSWLGELGEQCEDFSTG